MITFFIDDRKVYAVESREALGNDFQERLTWLFSGAEPSPEDKLIGPFTGPRREMITPWSTNAVEITQNMGIPGIVRIEQFFSDDGTQQFDPMLNACYDTLDQDVFTVEHMPEPVRHIEDIEAYNRQEGLALSQQEVDYLNHVSQKMGRPLTDSEVFGFSQVNSEHCRHKIFNGRFIIDGVEQPDTLFQLIKKTTQTNPNRVCSAYKDNCAFLNGPTARQFAPASHDTSDYYATTDFESVISIKAETHNFPTTVEPFNGAATGTGGEIRDRIAGGKGAFPSAGTAVYMTSYPRLEEGRPWEEAVPGRDWLYRTPEDILVKASNGASDFGNKFGQPLICGSVLTFEHNEHGTRYGYDKVIMQAGGIGYGKKEDSIKDTPVAGENIVVMGGDNYRIGMGGGAVSSVATGQFSNAIELNAVQRSNPEMQRRVYNAIRALSEEGNNPVVSMHDHGAGGHLNCLSELVEDTGGRIDLEKLPVGDPTLSAREIVGNESQERMGLVIRPGDVDRLHRIAERERAPMYVVGETTGDMDFTFVDNRTGEKPIDWPLEYMFGKSPRTVMEDLTVNQTFRDASYNEADIIKDIEHVLKLESVACKDWLTNKVDRSVTGRIARQQTCGRVQLPLADYGVVAMDYNGPSGMATAIGHAPVAALNDPAKGSVLAIAESLTNIVFAPLAYGLQGVSLSANWMWPCRNKGEDARLYKAVKAASDFAIGLGINIPTGKDSLSMTQKYPDGEKVLSPGTVIISSAAEVADIRGCVTPDLKHRESDIVYIDFSGTDFGLGGSSYAQVHSAVGGSVPTVSDPAYFAAAFAQVQNLVADGIVLAGHDVSAGGLVTALLEMTFADNRSGIEADLSSLGEADMVKVLFSERPAVVLQVENGKEVLDRIASSGVSGYIIGKTNTRRKFSVANHGKEILLAVDSLRDVWYTTSYLLDRRQSGEQKALERFTNYKVAELDYKFPASFTGRLDQYGLTDDRRKPTGIRAAVIREKGCQCEREMAWMMHLAGLDVKDVHMTDLVSGRETLEDVNLIVFVGGFSNSDVLGSAKGWAGAFLYNDKARAALEKFYAREDTLSLGVCNGCQLMIELGLIYPEHEVKPRMLHNDSGKFESGFVGVVIADQCNSVMLRSLSGSSLGIWIAHGEGKFNLPYDEQRYNIPVKYRYDLFPANPNGSDYNAAAVCSLDGRHLAIMPHLERSVRPWNWAHYPEERPADQVTPWLEVFVNAAEWIREKTGR